MREETSTDRVSVEVTVTSIRRALWGRGDRNGVKHYLLGALATWDSFFSPERTDKNAREESIRAAT